MAKRKYVKENNLVKAINTDSLELQKPLVNEYYDINVHNSNMDKIDAGYKQNKNDILNINNDLSKTENTKYSTTNGVKEFNCKDGYVDNVVVEGETLVNLVNLSTVNELEELFYVYNEPYLMFSNKTYTIVNNFNKDVYFEIKDFAGVFLRSYLVPPNSSDKISLSENECILSIAFKKVDGWTFELVEDNKNRGVVILEGDHTDKPISYFEGLKSVGQGDKIEVVSYKRGSENLASNLTFTEGFYVDSTDGNISNSASTEFKCSNEYIEVEGGCEYLFDNINGQFAIYDSSKNVIPIRWYNLQGDWLKGDGYQSTFVYAMPKNAKYVRINLPISNLKPYSLIKTKSDKKQISTTLRSLPNGVKDTIEKRGNKYVKVQRCGEEVLNQNSNVTEIYKPSPNGVESQTYIRCQIALSSKPKTSAQIYCDSISSKLDYEAVYKNIFVNGDEYQSAFLTLLVSELNSLDEIGVKNWLQSNPVTVVYELATPIITELPNFNPQTYEGDTTLLLNTGAIQGECEFEVTNSKGSEIEVIKYKLSSIDSQISESILALKELGGIL